MCTKYKVPTSSELRALNYTLRSIDFQNFPNEINGLNLFWRFSWIWVRISEMFVDLLPSSRGCNFFHRCRQPKKVYVFEKYSSRSLHFRCLFSETRNLTPSNHTMKFIEFHKNPKSRSAQPHQRMYFRFVTMGLTICPNQEPPFAWLSLVIIIRRIVLYTRKLFWGW